METDTVYKPLQSKSGSPTETKTLTQYLVLTFVLTWGLAAIFFLFTDQVTAIFGEVGLSNPLVILAVYSPGIVGVFLVCRHRLA